MRVLVTGAAGYVGRAALTALSKAGHEPVALLRRAGDIDGLGYESHVGDLLEPESLAAPLSCVDAVVHLAAVTRARESWRDPSKHFRVNTAGTTNLLAAMSDHNVRAIVFASTGSIYGSPDVQPMVEALPDASPHPYAASKRAAELAVEWHALSEHVGATILRVFNVAGGRDPDPTRVVPRVVAAAAGQTPYFEVNGDGSAVRDLLHIEDAARAFAAALDHLPPIGRWRRFNVGSGMGSSVADVVSAGERVIGTTIPVVYRPAVDEPATLVADVGRIMLELGWKPELSTLDRIVADAWQQEMNHD